MDDIIYYKNQIYLVPSSQLPEKVQKTEHDSLLARHLGFQKTYRAVRKCAEATGQGRRRGEFKEPRVEKDGFMEDPFRAGFGASATILTTSQKVTHTSWRVFLSPGTSPNLF